MRIKDQALEIIEIRRKKRAELARALVALRKSSGHRAANAFVRDLRASGVLAPPWPSRIAAEVFKRDAMALLRYSRSPISDSFSADYESDQRTYAKQTARVFAAAAKLLQEK